MTTPNAFHHIAISTADMKSQIAFFSDVLGMSLLGLFWMHGVPNAWHAFLEMGDASFSFVFIPGNEEKEKEDRKTAKKSKGRKDKASEDKERGL